MQAITYYLALPFLYLVAILPFPLLYGFADFLFVLLYFVLGYRKKVVLQNLRNAFPEWPEAERRRLARRFYRYLCDLILETQKTLVIPRCVMLRRCVISEKAGQLLDDLHAQNRHCIIVMGHFGNWEWAGNTFSLTRKHQLYVIYHPLQNKYFNDHIIGMRTRFGTKLIPMQDTMRLMLQHRNDPPAATAFIADQTPQPDRAYWMTFLNQDTPVFLGTEKIAQKLNYPIVYVSVKRVRRGRYVIDAELLFDSPKDTASGEITEAHTHRLEKDILGRPETWLWSHRRWKHKRPS